MQKEKKSQWKSLVSSLSVIFKAQIKMILCKLGEAAEKLFLNRIQFWYELGWDKKIEIKMKYWTKLCRNVKWKRNAYNKLSFNVI